MEPHDLESNAAKHVVDFFVKEVEHALSDLLVMRGDYYDIHYQVSSPQELMSNPSFQLILQRLKKQVENLRHLQSLVIMIRACMEEHGSTAEAGAFREQQNKLNRCIETMKQLSRHVVRATGVMI